VFYQVIISIIAMKIILSEDLRDTERKSKVRVLFGWSGARMKFHSHNNSNTCVKTAFIGKVSKVTFDFSGESGMINECHVPQWGREGVCHLQSQE
jgi:hypothetical protein